MWIIKASCIGVLTLFSAQVLAIVCYTDAAETAPSSAFIAGNSSTVTDARTQLTWATCTDGQVWESDECVGEGSVYDWQQALDRVVELNAQSYLGFSDWRLPNKNELASIVELACVNPAVNLDIFPDSLNGTYWTSTPDYASSAMAWRVVFNYGNVTRADRTDTYLIRLVR